MKRHIPLAGALAGAPTLAHAQTSADAPNEIVVTATLKAYEPVADIATRTGTPEFEVPFANIKSEHLLVDVAPGPDRPFSGMSLDHISIS